MARKKKNGNLAEDLFNNLMDDLSKEDGSVVDSVDETNAGPPTGLLAINTEKDQTNHATKGLVSYDSMDGTKTEAQVWKDLKENDVDLARITKAKKPSVPPPRSEADSSVVNLVVDDATVPVISEKTVAVPGHALAEGSRVLENETATKFGSDDKVVMSVPAFEKEFKAHVNQDASLAQAQALRLAQDKILSLEREVDKLRQENDDLAMAANVMRQRSEELQSRIESLEREKVDIFEQGQSEITLLKGQMNFKDSELSKARQKAEELEARLRTDFKKIRVKERELENRLEIVKAEKQALLRTKDEQILDLQRKTDHLKSELDHHRTKVQDMFKSMENKKDQMRKAVKALRLALTHLEAQADDLTTRKRE